MAIRVRTLISLRFISQASLFLSMLTAVTAFADLAVTPTRVDISEKQRNATVTLVSQAKEPLTYTVGFIHYKMNTDGSYTELEKARADDLAAEKMIRYSPRQVRLEPGESQVVRLTWQKPADLKDGEYRTHLLFRADPTSFMQSDSGSEGLSINLKVAKGVAIPLVIRQGNLDSDASIKSVVAEEKAGQTFFKVDIERKGTASPFGDIEIRAGTNNKGELLAMIRGVAVFLELTDRVIQIPLLDPSKKGLLKGPLKVQYLKPTDQGAGIIAEKQIQL